MASLLKPRVCLLMRQSKQLESADSALRLQWHRGLISGGGDDIYNPVPEFLIQEHDLPPADQDYLKMISRDEFVGKYGKRPPILRAFGPASIRRIATVLPLLVKECERVVPIPFIIDTGVPHAVYLGTGAVLKLRELQLIKDVTGVHPFRLMGTLCNQEQVVSVDEPYSSALPIQFEEPSIRGDVRLNLLGLPGIDTLKVLKIG